VATFDSSSYDWSADADLVVVGSGGGGLTSAVVASVEGLDVIVLEKSDWVGGTTAVSGGGLWIPLNHHMAEEGGSDSREDALDYLAGCAGPSGDTAVHEALIDNGPAMVQFLENRAAIRFRAWPRGGGTIDYRPWNKGYRDGARALLGGKVRLTDLPGTWGEKVRTSVISGAAMDPLDYYRDRLWLQPLVPGLPSRTSPLGSPRPDTVARGAGLIAGLLRAALQHGAQVELSTPARQLLVEDGRVVGVRATKGEEDWFVHARRGVVMASGGFGRSEERKAMWMRAPLEYTCEIEDNTGDGQLMGMAVGAQTARLGDAWWSPQMRVGPDEAGPDAFASSREDRHVPHTMVVNRLGRRFMNEALNYYDAGEAFGTRMGLIGNLPAWYVFDRQAVDKYSIVAYKVTPEPGQHVNVATSVEELASMMGIPPASLCDTVDRFNGFAAAGKDLDFDRGNNEWDRQWGDPNQRPNPSLGTIEKPPFYAIEMRSGALATTGGLRVNEHAQVLSANEPYGPIPGLYAVGNCSNGFVANSYPGPGATIGALMTFAYVAGKRVASGIDGESRIAALTRTHT
jgi:3-oxosteroid 1-dehydrogenase